MVRGRDSAGGAGSRVRAGGCGLPELDLEGEERVEEVGADEAPRVPRAASHRDAIPSRGLGASA